MQTQSRRDEKTMDIFAALLVFVGLVAVGGTALALAHWFLGLPDAVAGDFGMALVVLAAAGSTVHLARRPRSR